MHDKLKSGIVYALWLMIFSCGSPGKKDDETLMSIHSAQRQAHLTKNAKQLAEQFSKDFVEVNRGHIGGFSEEQLAGFQAYLDSSTFKKWDDLANPLIRFSDDHTLAYMVVDKLVVLDRKDSIGHMVEETTHYAWVAIFRRQPNGNFKMEAMASTNEPKKIKTL